MGHHLVVMFTAAGRSSPDSSRVLREDQEKGMANDSVLCKHSELYFEADGFYLRCFACAQLWQAIRPTGVKDKYEPGLRAGASWNIPRSERRSPKT